MQRLSPILYSHLFGDYENVDIKDFLNEIPTQNSLEIICHYLAQLHSFNENVELQYKILRTWLSTTGYLLNKKAFDFVKLTVESGNEFNFLNNISGLVFIEEVLKNQNNLKKLDKITSAQELNLLKAYLYSTQKWTDKQNQTLSFTPNNNIDDLIKILLPTQLPIMEFLHLKDFRIQFLKAKYFFEFCESDNQFRIYLEIFLKTYNLTSWQGYLKNIFTLYIRDNDNQDIKSILNVSSEFPEVRNFLNELCLDIEKFKSTDDFLAIREKPIYRLSDSSFLFLNLNFLIDKIYQGIQFDLARILVKNSATFNNKTIKDSVQFIGHFGNEFSEKGLLYKVMNYAFEKSKYVKLNGDQLSSILQGGAPDFYIRDKSKIYIFEFKNVYLNAKAKNSYSYDSILEEVHKKFVSNQSDSPKGVSQLVNVIQKITSGKFSTIDSVNLKSAIIYPIIIYVDLSFNLAGFNYILNKEFKKKIQQSNIPNTNIKDLILVDLDSFIKFQDLFRNKTLKLNNCFNEYYEHQKKNEVLNEITSFNMFIHKKTSKIEYDSPKILKTEIMKMFKPLV